MLGSHLRRMHPTFRVQAACMTHAACIPSRLHTGVLRATCRLHLEKYDLHEAGYVSL